MDMDMDQVRYEGGRFFIICVWIAELTTLFLRGDLID